MTIATCKVSLTEEELQRADRIARGRNEPKVRGGYGRSGTYEGKADTLDMHREAARAEIAVANAVGGTVDEGVYQRGNTRGNVLLTDGRRAFAKYRGKRGWDLALKSDSMKHFYGDLGFLVWPQERGVYGCDLEVIGWINRSEFNEKATVGEFMKGKPRLSVSRSALHDMGAFLASEPQLALF